MLKNSFENIQQKGYITFSLNIVFVLYALSFLLDSGAHRLAIYLATFLWLLEGNFVQKFRQIQEQKVILYYFTIVVLFLFSLTFLSDSISQGFWDDKYTNGYLYILEKPIEYFLIGMYMATSLKKEFIRYILIALFIQIFIMSLCSYGIYLNFIDPQGISRNIGLPTCKVHHIIFSILLSFGICLSVYFLQKMQNRYWKAFFVFSIILFGFDIFIVGSRTGYLIAIAFLLIFVFQYVKNIKHFMITIVALGLLGFIILTNVESFSERLQRGVTDIQGVVLSQDYSTSFGVRIAFNITNAELLFGDLKNFFLGYGMGDSKEFVRNYMEEHDPNRLPALHYDHVHNQYIQTWIDGGLLALLVYLLLFVKLYKLKVEDEEKVLIKLFIVVFLIYGLTDIIYHGTKILGLFAFFIGVFLTQNKYYKSVE